MKREQVREDDVVWALACAACSEALHVLFLSMPIKVVVGPRHLLALRAHNSSSIQYWAACDFLAQDVFENLGVDLFDPGQGRSRQERVHLGFFGQTAAIWQVFDLFAMFVQEAIGV